MICKQCGFNHGSQANFCPACGNKITEKERKESLSHRSPTKWFKILFSCILLGLAISILLILFSDNMTKVVSNQLQAIKENRLTEAYYDYSSKSFQKTTSLADFRNFFLNYPFFSHYKSVRFIDRDNGHDTGYLEAMMMTDQGVEIPLKYELVREGDQWFIDNIKFEDPYLEEKKIKTDQAEVFDDTPLRSAINRLMEQIQQSNLKQAYQKYTSHDFQKMTSFKEFESFIKENPNFSNHKLELSDLSFDNNIATIKGFLKGSDGKTHEVKYDLIEEKGTWKVFHVQLLSSNNQDVNDLQFSKFILGNEVDEKNLVQTPKVVFTDRTKDIYLNLYLTRVKPGTTVKVVFEHVDTGSKVTPISKIITDEGDIILTFIFSPPESGWPKGSYRLSATSSTGTSDSYHFKLEA